MKKPRVVVADDHAILSEGLRGLLEPEFEVQATVEDGRALVAAAEKLRPEVVVLDISMPLLNGIEAARQLKRADPGIKLVFLTMHSDVSHVREAFRAGACAYVLKRSASTELLTAIRAVLKGRSYLSPLVTKDVLEIFLKKDSGAEGSFAGLTPRQREVLQLLAEGHSIKEIAVVLNISGKTVEFHKYRMLEDLGLHSIAELTQYAIKHGIISIES